MTQQTLNINYWGKIYLFFINSNYKNKQKNNKNKNKNTPQKTKQQTK